MKKFKDYLKACGVGVVVMIIGFVLGCDSLAFIGGFFAFMMLVAAFLRYPWDPGNPS